MRRKLTVGRCVYCLKTSYPLTWDHVIPRAWYPATTPPNLAKWKAPCCPECNNNFSKLEEDLRLKLVLCTDSRDSLTSGISEKVRRSVNPRFATNFRDKKLREAKLGKIIGEIVDSDTINDRNIMPNFGPRTDLVHKTYHMFKLPQQDLEAFGVKLVRGMTYALSNLVIGDDYVIQIHYPDQSRLDGLMSLIGKYPETYHKGPGIIVRRGRLEGDDLSALFQFEIWGKFKMVALVARNDFSPPAQNSAIA